MDFPFKPSRTPIFDKLAMKLPKMRHLMGLLARDMQRKQVKEMLAALPASCISQTEREDCKSAISFFVLLKKRTGTDEAFLSKLEGVLSECNCADFLSRIHEYKVQNPDLFQEPPMSQLGLPDGTRTGFKPKPGQSEKFRSSLLRISRSVGKKQLEIMVGLSPTPEAAKQNISEGHELFEQMERHGCISENDTEMLQEMLELLRLQDALKFLYEYHRAFPPVIHDPPPPSAPRYASLPPSSSLQAQQGSLPGYLSQPQSSHISQPQSLPFSPSPGSHGGGAHSSVTHYGQQPSYSNIQASLGQGGQHYLSSSSSFAPLSHPSSSPSESHSAPAPLSRGGGLSMPYMESGEQNSSISSQRQFVPSESPSLQRPSLGAAMKSFPRQGGGGGRSAASSPPQSHTPSLAGNSNNIVAQPLAKKQAHGGGATPNGSLPYDESRSAPTSSLSSSTYPRPMQERGKGYQFPTRQVLNNRQQNRVSGQSLPKENNDDSTAFSPPPAKIRRSSPDQHNVGDGGCLSVQNPRTRQPSNQSQQHQGQLPPPSSSASVETGDSLASFSTTGSEKFGVAMSQGHIPNPGGSGGEAAAAVSLSSLESYPANFSFPAGGEQMPSSVNVSGLQQPVHDATAAANQRPPPFNPYYVPTSSVNESEQQSLGGGGGGGDQLRNAQPVGSVECVHHPDDLVGPHVQQPFQHQYASHSVQVAGFSMPSLSHPNYPGHPSSEFPSGIQDEGGVLGETQPPGSSHKKKKSSSQAYNSPPAPADKRKSVLSKSEARSAQGATAQFESLNEAAVGHQSQLSKYRQQLLDYEKRRSVPNSQVTEQGRNIAQASSENNVELRRTGSIQGALATAKEGEQALQQHLASSENLLYQTAAESNKLYPRLPLDTASFETANSSSSGASAAPTGTKRTRSQSRKSENSKEAGIKKEEGEEEEQGTAAKRQKTNKKPSTSSKKQGQGLVSRVVGYFFRSSARNDDEQSQEEGCESESEYHSATED